MSVVSRMHAVSFGMVAHWRVVLLVGRQKKSVACTVTEGAAGSTTNVFGFGKETTTVDLRELRTPGDLSNANANDFARAHWEWKLE